MFFTSQFAGKSHYGPSIKSNCFYHVTGNYVMGHNQVTDFCIILIMIMIMYKNTTEQLFFMGR